MTVFTLPHVVPGSCMRSQSGVLRRHARARVAAVLGSAMGLLVLGHSFADTGAQLTRDKSAGDLRLRLDVTQQVLKISTGPLPPAYDEPPQVLPPVSGDFTPSSVLIAKAKQFDDGLLAAVELAAMNGLGDVRGRREFVRDLARLLAADTETPEALRGVVGGALRYADPGYTPPAAWQPAVNAAVSARVSDPGSDPPHGFYTWTDDLRRVFSTRRMLQKDVTRLDATFVGSRVARDASLLGRYQALLRLDAAVWNKGKVPNALQAAGAPADAARFKIMPGGRSHEVEIVEELYGGGAPPPDFDPMAVLIDRVRTGKLSLEPKPDSGWYDWISWAHEALLRFDACPERRKLEPDPNYLALLVEQFRGAYVQARESFTGGVEGGVAGAVEGRPIRRIVMVDPDLTVEPLPEFYGRRARAYAFIADVLKRSFGSAGAAELRRQLPEGTRAGRPLMEELEYVASLFRGAAALASREIALAQPSSGTDADVARFQDWTKNLVGDPDVGRDARSMVQVFYDTSRGKTKVWMFLGWYTEYARIEYAVRPTLLGISTDKGDTVPVADVDLNFRTQYVQLLRPAVATAYVSKVLDRDAFRALCTKYRTTQEILAHLE